MDPKLSKNKKEYGGFLKDMHKRGMIEFGTQAAVRLGVFFVEKKMENSDS